MMSKFSFLNPERVFDLKYVEMAGNLLKLLEILQLAFGSGTEKPEQLHFQKFCMSVYSHSCQGIKRKINDQSCLNASNKKK